MAVWSFYTHCVKCESVLSRSLHDNLHNNGLSVIKAYKSLQLCFNYAGLSGIKE